MIDRASIFSAVPVGKENAVGLAKIEESVGLWSKKKVRLNLAELVASGQVRSTIVPGARRHGMTIYFRPRV
jgi:hypothetical protein